MSGTDWGGTRPTPQPKRKPYRAPIDPNEEDRLDCILKHLSPNMPKPEQEFDPSDPPPWALGCDPERCEECGSLLYEQGEDIVCPVCDG